jgi:hypothetical protein
MNEESFRRLATSFIQPFQRHGFTILEEDYQAEVFGNAYAMFENSFRLRLTRDRGQLFVEVGPKTDPERRNDWYDLRLVLKFLGDDVDMEGVNEASIDQIRTGLDAKYQTVSSLFSQNNFAATKAQLDAYREQRIKQLFNLD